MLLPLLHLLQAALATHSTRESYLSITQLQRYEDASKKLAKYSAEAGRQLRKTRLTQAAGAAVVVLSLLLSLYLAMTGPGAGSVLRALESAGMAAVVFGARWYMQGYWTKGDGKTVGPRVLLPGMDGYNDAQRRTEQLLRLLGWLVYTWVGTAVASLLVG